MDPVVLAGQDDVPVLQEHDPAGKAKVRVGPLVDLVGHGYEDDEGKDVALPGTGLTQGLCKTPAAAMARHTLPGQPPARPGLPAAAGADRGLTKAALAQVSQEPVSHEQFPNVTRQAGKCQNLSTHHKQEVKLSLPSIKLI